MKIHSIVATLAFAFTLANAEEADIPNPKIDYPAFLENAIEIGEIRQKRRVTEEDFIRMAAEPGTIIFDARSGSKFKMLHIKGARHLSFPDLTEEELAKVIPNKNTRILIYCNNNFENQEKAFASKVMTASLNIFTFNALFNYGYENIYELGPLIDINETILPFEGTLVDENGRVPEQKRVSGRDRG